MPTPTIVRSFVFALAASWVAILSAAPIVQDVSLRGLRVGQRNLITLSGQQLGPETVCLLPIRDAVIEIQPGRTDSQFEVAVTLPATVAPNIYALRVASQHGISAPVALGVDQFPQIPFASHTGTLPVALHGRISGAQVLTTTFNGNAGQRLVADMEARRLGSNWNPVLRLLDDRGIQLAWAQSQSVSSGDARFELTLPGDGPYTIQLHDLLYRAPDSSFFRLKLGDVHFADRAFPAAVQRGGQAEVRYLGGSFPQEFRSRIDVSNQPLGTIPWPDTRGFTGSQPRLLVTDHPEVVESNAEPAAPQVITDVLPVGIHGQLRVPGEEDQFLVPIDPQQEYRVQVFAQRLGSPLDGLLTIRSEDGKELAASDDQAGTADPGLDFSPPEGTERVVVALSDLHGRGGEAFSYRVVLFPLNSPVVRLSLDGESIELPVGGRHVQRISLQRSVFSGPVRFLVEGLPAGIQFSGGEFVADSNVTLLQFSADESANQSSVVSIAGSAVDAEQPRFRYEHPGSAVANLVPSEYEPSRLGIGLLPPTGRAIDWEGDIAAATLPAGGKLLIPIRIARGDTDGSVRIRLITDQTIPTKEIEDPENKDKKKTVDDLDRALRLGETALFAAGDASPAIEILVPADLPPRRWQLALLGEWLAEDAETVTNTAHSRILPIVVTEP
jgi:hypothetical protein